MKNISIPSGIKALIFDCDGTLVNSMPLHMQAWEVTLKQFGVKYDEKYLTAMNGMKETDIVNLYNQAFGTKLNPDKVVATKYNYIKQYLNTVKPIEPVVEVARSYYGKLPLAVVSGSARNIVNEELMTTGIFDLFDYILTGDDSYKAKPASDIFYAAAAYMNVEPQLCLVLEDADSGLEGASKAGMHTIDVRQYI